MTPPSLRKLSPALALALAVLGAGLVIALHRTLGAETPRAAAKAQAIARTTAQNPVFQAAPSPTKAYWVNAALRSIQQADRDVVSGRVVDAAGKLRARVDLGELVPPELRKQAPPHGLTVRAALPSGGWLELDVRGQKRHSSFLVDLAAALGAGLLLLLTLVLRARRAEEPSVVPKIRAALTDSGAAFPVASSIAFAAAPDDAETPRRALAVAEEHLGSDASVGRQTTQVLLRALEAHDPRLASFSAELAELAVALGTRLGMQGDKLELLGRAAELHDLGKLAIPQSVLEKAGPLDEDEWRLMRQHPAIGERIVSSVPALAAVGPIVRATNERWDGTGYPDGKAGEDIPLAARVIAVCAAWQAMTSGPPYREPMSRKDALAELEAAAGTQFDAGVVYLLADTLRDGPRKPAPRARALLARARA